MSDEDVQVYQYGFQCRASFKQSSKSSDIISIAYSPFSGDFAFLDGAGITHWNKDTQIDKRLLTYSSNKKQLLKQIIFIPKYGIYFALAKDNTLQLLNSMLQRTFVFDADNCTILCLLYDIKKDMIITAGVGGLKMFRYLHHKCDRDLAGTDQYFLQYKHYPVRPSQWITRIQLYEAYDRLVCVAQKEIILLTCDGDYLFTINTAPSLPLTDCCYCSKFKYYITASIDSAMKIWSEQGTLLHTFTSHSKAVTSVLMHPQSDLIMISASLDKSVRLWNLETFEEIYKLQICEYGIQWVGLTRDKYLYCGTSRDLTVWSISFVAHFFSQTRVPVSNIRPVLHCNTKKTPRVIAVGEDSSVRLLSVESGQSVSTILPPPDISPLNKILDVGYSRYYGLIFLLIDRLNIWIYTTRTDPASRVDNWDDDILKLMLLATEDVSGTLGVIGSIECLTVLHSHITVEGEEGPVTPTCVNLLVLGLQDGRLVFVDPIVKGLKYHVIAVHRDPVCVGAAGTVFTVIENCIVSSIETESLLQAHTLIFKSDDTLESQLLAEKRQDSQSAYDIHTLDGCPEQDLVVSCSGDGTLRIWTRLLVPTREIILNSTLTTACFLNKAGDLLLGFLGNIYKISAAYTNDGKMNRKTSVASYLTDSTVFEDPAIKYDNMGEVPATNIDNYLMPYKGKYQTDWQGLCVTDLEEPEIEAKKSGESEQGDSVAPSDFLLSPPESVDDRSVINLSLSELSESVYFDHYDAGTKEVQDAWQMPVCGVSPRTSLAPRLLPTPREEPGELPFPMLTDKPSRHPMSGSVVEKPFKTSYQLPIQRRCSHKKPDKVAFENALSDLSLTSVSDEDKEITTKKKERKSSAALWKPNGPNSPDTDIQKVIKKKKLEKKRSRKRVALVQRRSTDRFSDRFSDITRTTDRFSDRCSDITRTTDDSTSMLSDEVSDSVADGKELEEGVVREEEKVQDVLGGKEQKDAAAAVPETDTEAMDVVEATKASKYLEKSVLDTVKEGVTEGVPGITEWVGEGNMPQKTSKEKLKAARTKLALSFKSPTAAFHNNLSDPANLRQKFLSRVTSAPQQRPNSEVSSLKQGTTVARVTERLTNSKSMISRQRMESRAQVAKRVQSAPEVRQITPPTLNRTKQGCPLTFSELMKAEEKGGVKSKWVLQCLESDVFYKSMKPKKRIASAPPRFTHPPGSLRPPYMDKPPKPAVEPAYDEEWHEKVVGRQENRRKLAEQRRLDAAERRRALDTQKQQKAALIRDKSSKSNLPRGSDYQQSGSPPPAPLPTAASSTYPPPPTLQTTPSLQSFPVGPFPPSSLQSSNYRVKSAMSFTTPTRPPSSFDQSGGVSDHSSVETMLVEAPNKSPLETSPILAKAAFLRNASQQILYQSTTASVG